jgi:hypothetical protein
LRATFDENLRRHLLDKDDHVRYYAACRAHSKAFSTDDFLTWHRVEIYYEKGQPVIKEEDKPRTKCVCCKHLQSTCECRFEGKDESETLTLFAEGYSIHE